MKYICYDKNCQRLIETESIYVAKSLEKYFGGFYEINETPEIIVIKNILSSAMELDDYKAMEYEELLNHQLGRLENAISLVLNIIEEGRN